MAVSAPRDARRWPRARLPTELPELDTDSWSGENRPRPVAALRGALSRMAGKLKVVIAGINGRFGRASARAVLGQDDLELVGAFGKPGADYVGKDVGELASTLDTGILV